MLFLSRYTSFIEVQGHCAIDFVDLVKFDADAPDDGGRQWWAVIRCLPSFDHLFVFDREG